MDLKEERAIGGDPRRHWYYIAKGRAIMELIGSAPASRLLDVGAGSGVFAQMLIEKGLAASAVCVDPNYEENRTGMRAGDRIAYLRQVESVDADLVLMIDVIEHVDDDRGLVARYAAAAAPGTRFLVSVPAFDYLWSSHDEFLEHRRRYTLKGLEAVLRAAGLEILDGRYFFGLLFPAAAAQRLAERAMKGERQAAKSALKPAPRWLNDALVAVHDLERATLFPINRLAGVTAFCLAARPEVAPAVAAA